MGGCARWLVAIAIVAASAIAQPPKTERAIVREALCPEHGYCRVESVLHAGEGPGGWRLAVVRLRSGRRLCVDERSYRDWLVAIRGEEVRTLRALVQGPAPCLEWELSRWTFEDGELVFHWGMMGAPPSADTDMRPSRVHFQPWPLVAVRAFIGEDPMPIPQFPDHGPLFRISEEESP